MNGERWQRVQAAFKQAVTAPPEQRPTLLAQACGGDAGLQAEVESLLAHDERAPADFLQPPPAPVPLWLDARTADGPDPLIGAKIGRYQVQRVIAAGGMGTVYEAVQEQPHRVVALKVLKPGCASRAVLRRFYFEAEVLGRLRHPHIAQIYEAGMHDPNRDREGADKFPYFAMEYVPDAQPITAFAETQGPDTRARLKLFALVCDAVQHGHQNGIIHRDLKPANILVGADGAPKVIDFGVARVTDKDLAVTTQATSVGQLIGTLQYMSPEQCDGNPTAIDTRSDVYSLGVVLYELLTGGLPYEATGVALLQATRAIKEALPRRPSTTIGCNGRPARHLRGDLDTIVLKALEKDREKRYGSVAALADDVRRYLSGEPIAARPLTAWFRSVRWALRHPVWITATACALFAAATGAATWATVWFVNARPARAVVVDEGREARLLALDGRILKSWPSLYRGSFGFAELVARPATLGGGRLLLLGFVAKGADAYAPALVAYDADGAFERTEWERRLEDDDIPQRLRQRTDYLFGPGTFGVGQGLVADVFGDTPGENEVIVIHQHVNTTHGAVRVYDLRGETLYQVWLDCWVEALCWMKGPRLLVLAGMNGEAFWEDRGEQAGSGSHPHVVFALRPERGFQTTDYVAQEPNDQELVDERLRPIWYKCLLPACLSNYGGSLELGVPDRACNEGEVVLLARAKAAYPTPLVSVHWALDQHGEPTAGPIPGDDYRRNQMLPDDDARKLPPIDWQLGPLPPIQRRTDKTAMSQE